MSQRGFLPLGGVIHTYQKYDPVQFPSPSQPAPDLVSPAMEHLLMYGSMRELSEAELAQAIRLDASQIAGLGPSLEALQAMLEERKRKILEKYETDTVQADADQQYLEQASTIQPPKKHAEAFHRAVREEQLLDLENLWYRAEKDKSNPFPNQLLQLMEKLADKYLVEELASKYSFTGQESMTIPEALAIREELEKIDKLLQQLKEAEKNAQIAVIDLTTLSEFAEPGQIEQLNELQTQIENYIREQAERQGLEQGKRGFELSPRAYRLFQSKLLELIFRELQASRSGRHQGPIVGEGAVELMKTKAYEFGDSIANMDVPASMVNAMIRQAEPNKPIPLPVRMKPEDIQIHYTRNNPKCATVVLLDMSGSMRHGYQYINVKRMGLALDGLIRKEYPGDYLQFLEMYTFAKPRHISEVPHLMPKPVTIFDPVVRLKVDMSDPNASEVFIPPHFTNIQHGMRLARQFMMNQPTPNKQIFLITDGLPTAHFENETLFLLYPPDPRTEQATLREAALCAREGITINIFLMQSWNQSEEDIQFAYQMAESTKGRVIFVAGRDLDRYVVWDYIKRRKQILS